MVKDSHTQISIESIQNYVCDYFGIDTNKVNEKTRKQEIVGSETNSYVPIETFHKI